MVPAAPQDVLDSGHGERNVPVLVLFSIHCLTLMCPCWNWPKYSQYSPDSLFTTIPGLIVWGDSLGGMRCIGSHHRGSFSRNGIRLHRGSPLLSLPELGHHTFGRRIPLTIGFRPRQGCQLSGEGFFRRWFPLILTKSANGASFTVYIFY
jgi:hypothetical protein